MKRSSLALSFFASLHFLPNPATSAPIRLENFDATWELFLDRSLLLKSATAISQAELSSAQSDLRWRNPEVRSRYQGRSSQDQIDMELRVPVGHPFERYYLRKGVEAAKLETEIQNRLLLWQMRCELKESYYHFAYLKREWELNLERISAWKQASQSGAGQRAVLGLLEAEQDQQKLLHEKLLAKERLANLLSSPPSAFEVQHSVQALLDWQPLDLDTLPSIEPAQFKSSQTLEQRARRAESRLSAERAKRIPWLSMIEGGYQLQPFDEKHWQVRASIEIPLFSQNQDRITQARSEHDSARHLYEQSLLEINTRLETLKTQYQIAADDFEREHETYKRLLSHVFEQRSPKAETIAEAQQLDQKILAARIYLRRYHALKKTQIELERILEREF